MAQIRNPRKQYNFSLSFPQQHINPFLFQKADLPDSEIEEVAHGDTNHDAKTGGRLSIGSLTLEKLLTTERNVENNYFWDWHTGITNGYLGGGLPPSLYWRNAILEEFAEDGVTVINRWVLDNIWPKKINGQSHERKSSDNTIEVIEFAVELMDKQF